jgi:acyl dehydratase
VAAPPSTELVTDLAGLLAQPHRTLGHSDWVEMTQEQVDRFADLTGDRNFIHVDPERARTTPFGGTVAHGLLTLSLLAPVTQRLQVADAALSINYGLDRLRFPSPLRVGDRWRGTADVLETSEIPGGVQAKVRATIEIEGSEKPAAVADFVLRYYA